MNRFYAFLLLLFTAVWFLPQGVQAQCTPTRDACEIDPDDELPACYGPEQGVPGIVGEPYEHVMYFRAARTVNYLNLIEAEISRLVIDPSEAQNVPAGLSIEVVSGNPDDEPYNFTAPAGTPIDAETGIFGCAQISGTPEEPTASTDSIVLVAQVFIRVLTNGQPSGDERDPNSIPGVDIDPSFTYHIPISGSVSIEPRLKAAVTEISVYPNPADGQVEIAYALPQSVSDLQLSLHAIDGTEVMSRNLGHQHAGQHNHTLNLQEFPSGLYSVEIIADGQLFTQKLILR